MKARNILYKPKSSSILSVCVHLPNSQLFIVNYLFNYYAHLACQYFSIRQIRYLVSIHNQTGASVHLLGKNLTTKHCIASITTCCSSPTSFSLGLALFKGSLHKALGRHIPQCLNTNCTVVNL